MQSEQYPIVVIGGGIGGLATALALGRKGKRVHLLEQAKAFEETGAGLQLAPNALRVLKELGVVDRVKADAVFPRRIIMLDALTGEQITALNLGDQFVERYGEPYIVTHRADLHAALLDACKNSPLISLETNRRVLNIEDCAVGARIVCAGGAVYEAEILIGADGLHSILRRYFGDQAPPTCAQYVAYRGTVSMKDMSVHADADNVVLWVGPDLHLVQYPVRRAELYNQVAVFRSHCYAPDSDDWGSVAELDECFSVCCAQVQAAIEHIGRGRRWPLYDRKPLKSWVQGNAVLLGDAAHPMLQYLAQGACQALEDASVLADQLSDESRGHRDALARYQKLRRDRTARVQLTAHYFGQVCHITGFGAVMRNTLLRGRSETDYGVVDWLYGRKPDVFDAADSSALDWLHRQNIESQNKLFNTVPEA